MKDVGNTHFIRRTIVFVGRLPAREALSPLLTSSDLPQQFLDVTREEGKRRLDDSQCYISKDTPPEAEIMATHPLSMSISRVCL